MISAWPHRIRPKIGMTIAVVVAIARAAGLVVAAHLDNALWLPGEGVGLFEHPGVLAIVVGDTILFLLCVYASRMTRSVGRRLPTNRRPLVQRYFRLIMLRRIFASGGSFSKMLLFLSVIGALSLVNQTVQLTDAGAYYGHDTFDSTLHPQFGDRIRSKMRSAQINEALCKVLCHNLCVLIRGMHELNLDPIFWRDAVVAGELVAPERGQLHLNWDIR